jgi:hypothetical protein
MKDRDRGDEDRDRERGDRDRERDFERENGTNGEDRKGTLTTTLPDRTRNV